MTRGRGRGRKILKQKSNKFSERGTGVRRAGRGTKDGKTSGRKREKHFEERAPKV